MIGSDILAGIFIVYVLGCLMGAFNIPGMKRRTWGSGLEAGAQAVVGLTLIVLAVILL